MIHILLIALLASPGVAGLAIAVTLAAWYVQAVRADRCGNTPQDRRPQSHPGV